MSFLLTRRSVRSYKSEQIKESELDHVLQAGLYAPSGRNLQTAVMVSITNRELVSRLSEMNAKILEVESDPFYGAPCVVIVFADPTTRTGFEDGCLVMGNMMNAAHEIGLGSCWIHRARQMFESEEGKALMKQWGVPEHYVGVGNCILGYADGELPAASPRRDGRIIKLS